MRPDKADRDRADVIGGVALALLGLAVAGWAAANFDLGTPRRMGPGFFPLGLGLLLAILGAIVALTAAPAPGARPRVALPELVALIAAIVIFAVGLERIGLVPTTVLSVLVSSTAVARPGILWRLVLAVAVTAISVAVFSYGLAMNLPLLP